MASSDTATVSTTVTDTVTDPSPAPGVKTKTSKTSKAKTVKTSVKVVKVGPNGGRVRAAIGTLADATALAGIVVGNEEEAARYCAPSARAEYLGDIPNARTTAVRSLARALAAGLTASDLLVAACEAADLTAAIRSAGKAVGETAPTTRGGSVRVPVGARKDKIKGGRQ